MNLDELRSVQSKERQTDSLQHLRESFYADASAYVSELEAERDRRAGEVEDPFADPEVRRLTDEVETAREVVEAIYDRRLGKLVKRASLAAAAHPTDEDGLTAEEQELYDDLVDLIEANKTRVLDVIDADPERDEVAAEEAAAVTAVEEDEGLQGDAAPSPDERTAADPDTASATSSAGGEVDPDGTATREQGAGSSGEDPETPGGGETDESALEDVPSDGPDAAGLDGRTTVRIVGEVDEFFGVDQREYDLEPETVVTLPAENARPLLESGDAERVE